MNNDTTFAPAVDVSAPAPLTNDDLANYDGMQLYFLWKYGFITFNEHEEPIVVEQ